MTPYLLILAVLLGLAPGLIARSKGRNLLLWWIYGAVLGPVALLHAILLRDRPRAYAPAPDRRPQRRRSSPWPAALLVAASVAIAIVAVATYGWLAPPKSAGRDDRQEVAVSADRTAPDRRAPRPTDTASAPATGRAVVKGVAPTVRVTVRQEPPEPPEQQTARAPVAPVERAPMERTTATPARDQPKPQTAAPSPPRPADTAVAARPAPAVTAPAAPPAANTPEKSADTPEKQATATAEPAKPAATPAPQPKAAPSDVTAVGDTVRLVQQALAEKGYRPGPANGRAGRETQAAIRKFQSDRGLQPTGAIDYALLENLGIVGPRVHAFRPPPGATPGR